MIYDYKRLMMERNKCCRGSLLANKCVLCSFVEEVRGKLYYCTKICFTYYLILYVNNGLQLEQRFC